MFSILTMLASPLALISINRSLNAMSVESGIHAEFGIFRRDQGFLPILFSMNRWQIIVRNVSADGWKLLKLPAVNFSFREVTVEIWGLMVSTFSPGNLRLKWENGKRDLGSYSSHYLNPMIWLLIMLAIVYETRNSLGSRRWIPDSNRRRAWLIRKR